MDSNFRFAPIILSFVGKGKTFATNSVFIKHVIYLAAYIPFLIVKYLDYVLGSSPINILRDLALITVVGRTLVPVEDAVYKHGLIGAIKLASRAIQSYLFEQFLGLPLVSKSVDKQVEKVLGKIEQDIIQRGPEFPEHLKLVDGRTSRREVVDIALQLNKLKQSDWENGRLSGAVYHNDKELMHLQTQMFHSYLVANQLHPDCFPAVRRMDAEVVSMVLDLYNAPETGCGTTTSGGTESLLLTSLAAREYARHTRGLTEFEIIAPITVHAGFDKAAHYFNMKLVHAPLNPETMQVDLKAVESLIGPNTVLLVGSAPNFPHGIIDDIEGLGKIAQSYNLPLHVDACLGSFIVPFIEEFKPFPKFDFRVPGVTSISCDTHKYGFAPKGSSVIMYRTPELRKYQYFVSTDWTGGLYASPTLAGSRPGALVAGCWATMLYMGRAGYRASAKRITGAAALFRQGLENNAHLFFVYGQPEASVVAFGSRVLNIYDLSDAMAKRGWHLSALQNPPALHLAATDLTDKIVKDLLRDLVECGEALRVGSSDAANAEGTKALYGVAGSVKTAGVAERLAEGFVDFLYKP